MFAVCVAVATVPILTVTIDVMPIGAMSVGRDHHSGFVTGKALAMLAHSPAPS